MWMQHDLAWWGAVLSVLALILMLPVAILANLLTPKLRNWWSERSIASLKKRIENLEKQLADYEQNYPLLTPTEHHILRGIDVVGMVTAVGVQMIAVLILVGTVVVPSLWRTHGRVQVDYRLPLTLLAFVALAFSFSVIMVVLKGIAKFRRKRSPIDRDFLRESIEKLKERLAQRTIK
jgi:hypothetical protein